MKKLDNKEFEERMKIIDELEEEEPTVEDIKAIETAEKEDSADSISLDDYKNHKEYSGKLMIRVPRSLHKELVESAKKEGVSLNQYALYKLAK